MELYIHIPFCKSKCQYCDFKSFPCLEKIDEYLSYLKKEIKFSGDKFKNRVLDTIYIGGGTPSILSKEQISSIVFEIRNSFNISKKVEFTIECNPESIEEDKLKVYKELGINRISMGIQSLNDKNLKAIGRIHNSKLALEKLELLNKYFSNVSVDLIIGLPYDTEDSIREEVGILAPKVSHISMYELILEEGTKLYDRVNSGELKLLDDDKVVSLFNVAKDVATKNGFDRYEVSNFAKNDQISKHNFGYWTREEYLGLGLNSSSLITRVANIRYKNAEDFDTYFSRMEKANNFDEIVRDEIQYMEQDEVLYEEIMLGLRTTKGIKKEKIENLIPQRLKVFFKEKDGYISLTDDGMSVMNSILCEILQ